MKTKTISVKNIQFGGGKPFVLIAGPCVIESRAMAIEHAKAIKAIADKVKVPFVFKASYDKANRTSIESFRGPGLEKGLAILKEIKDTLKIPVLSDVHEVKDMEPAGKVLDIIQIPAFLCRQTDIIVAAAKTGKIINVKKGQFLAPADMVHIVKKLETSLNKKILLTERGTTFGYNNLVTDFRSLEIMQQTGYPVIFDATHSVQQPGGLGHASGGNREFVPLLARCAMAAGCDGLFMEVHKNPDKALSDGPNMLPLKKMESLLKELKAYDQLTKKKS